MGFFKDVRQTMKLGNELRDQMPSPAETRKAASAVLAQQAAAARLALDGQDGTATITSVVQTNQRINFDMVLELELLVIPEDGRPPYPLTLRQPVANTALPMAVTGRTVKVKLHPGDPQSVLIQWTP